MDLTQLKKAGNKAYSLAVKIEEADKSGLKHKIPDFVKKLKEVKDKINEDVSNLEKKYLKDGNI